MQRWNKKDGLRRAVIYFKGDELFTPEFAMHKINYLNLKPVKAGFVSKPKDWMYSSAQDYVGEKGKVAISFLI